MVNSLSVYKGTLLMKTSISVIAALLLAVSGSAFADGCIKGAAVGAVGGHVAGNHAVVGAVGGCVVGRHLANKKAKEKKAAEAQQARPPAPPAHAPDSAQAQAPAPAHAH
jgi:membrane associated rhomboid family serine protease